MGGLYLAAAAVEAVLALHGPWALPWGRLVYTDGLFLALPALHAAAGLLALALPRARQRPLLRLHASELLFTLSLVLFLFAWIFALNANLDYAQRFFAGGAKMRLALDTRAERLAAAVRYLPLLAADLAAYLWARLSRRPAPGRDPAGRVRLWALPLTLLSAALTVLSFPSFASLDGLGFLCFVALVPLFLVVENCSLAAGWLYVTGYGVLQGMLLNYWLGTYSLVTLQLVTVVYLLSHAAFFLPALALTRRLGCLRLPALALAWVVFEYLRSIGYWGYPWGLWGTAPYRFLPLIQAAAVGGVWAVGLLVLLLNAGAAAVLGAALRREDPAPAARALLGAAALFLAGLFYGLFSLDSLARQPVEKSARVALVQQNSDPRKDDYARTFAVLKRLTDEAMSGAAGEGLAGPRPELVVWSETAFVPNIRRWSREDPEREPLARLVREFLDYQRGLGVWLLTGNDDYELAEERRDYNAAVLFDPEGRRVRTYHKMHLVPFTEYFPFREQLPGVYRWLLDFDVYLWEPGRERVVFQHPKFRFATPICFEDSFPDDLRRFVLDGAEAIVNIANDYWSLAEVEAKQHAVNSLFRAVENRRPLLRATASGLPACFDVDGSLRADLPYYREGFLVADVPFRRQRTTLYTRWGDWLPPAAAGLLGLLAVLSRLPRVRRRLAPRPPRP